MTLNDNKKKAIATLLFYVFAGPPIGGFIYSLMILIFVVVNNSDGFFLSIIQLPLGLPFVLPIIVPIAVIFGYLFGGVFALATGLILAFLIYKNGSYSYVTALLVLLFIFMPVALLLIYNFQEFEDHSWLDVVTMWLIPSLFSTLICRWLFFKIYIK